MAQLPLPEILATFLSRRDAKALRCVSRTIAENPLSLPAQLLAMTRRANAEQKKCGALQAEHLRVKYMMEANIMRINRDVNNRNVRLIQQGDRIADLVLQVQELQPDIAAPGTPTAEEDAYWAAEAEYHPNGRGQ